MPPKENKPQSGFDILAGWIDAAAKLSSTPSAMSYDSTDLMWQKREAAWSSVKEGSVTAKVATIKCKKIEKAWQHFASLKKVAHEGINTIIDG